MNQLHGTPLLLNYHPTTDLHPTLVHDSHPHLHPVNLLSLRDVVGQTPR